MDACLELFLEELQLTEGLERRPMPFESLGGPSFFDAGRHLQLMVHEDGEPIPPRLLARIPPDLRSRRWLRVSVEGEGLDLYASSINRSLDSADEREPENDGFEQLLRGQLVAARAWVVLFLWQCEDAAESFSADGVEPVIAAFRRQLTWGSESRGFAASHRLP